MAALISAREPAARQSGTDMEVAAQAARIALDLDLDPGKVSAWTTLDEIQIMQAARSLRLAADAASAALALDPDNAQALAIRGWRIDLALGEGRRPTGCCPR